MPRSPLDETVRLLTLRARVRVPFRAPTAPFDSPDVFEALGLHEPAPIDVQMGTTRSARRPAHEIAPFSYASRTSLEWPEANTVHGRLYLLPGRPAAPLCVLVHGNKARNPRFEHARARLLLKRGMHAASFCFAGHMDRTPAGERTGEHTASPDLHGCVQTFVQAAGDAGDLVRWLRMQDFVTSVGLAGWSAGGMTTMLAMTLVDLDFAAAVVPATDTGFAVTSRYMPLGVSRGVLGGCGDRGEASRLTAAIAPANRKPRMPEHFVIVAAERDELCGTDRTRAAWEAWGRPPIRWVDRGHLGGALTGSRLALNLLCDAVLDGKPIASS